MISPADQAIADAASVAVEEAFGVSNRFSDAVCALEAVVTNAATVEDASSHALCPKFHLPFDIFSIFIPVLDRIIAGANRVFLKFISNDKPIGRASCRERVCQSV